MLLANLLQFPLPLVVGVVYMTSQDLSSLDGANGPDWLIGAVAGIWLVVWLLEKLGKLPGKSSRTVGFMDRDREMMKQNFDGIVQLEKNFTVESERWRQLHGLLTFRSDEDGIERWLRHHQITTESKVILEKLVLMTEEVKALRTAEDRKTGILLSTLEANNKALLHIQKQLDYIKRQA